MTIPNSRVLIFGGSGQDGSLLARWILDNTENTQIHLTSTSLDKTNLWRIHYLSLDGCISIHAFDMSKDDPAEIIKIVAPHQIYILSGLTKTADSISSICQIALINVYGFSNILEAIRTCSPEASVFVAGSSEMFGRGPDRTKLLSCDDTNICIPTNPYGSSKLYQFNLVEQYRHFYGIDICTGVLFNHESELRSSIFVTKKITRNLVRFNFNKQHSFALGSLSSKRDWSSARDFVRGFYKVVQDRPNKDYVFSSSTLYSVREFLLFTCSIIGLDVRLIGDGMDERLIDHSTGHTIVSISPRYYRTNDTAPLCGDNRPLKDQLDWEPLETLQVLIEKMVHYDLQTLRP